MICGTICRLFTFDSGQLSRHCSSSHDDKTTDCCTSVEIKEKHMMVMLNHQICTPHHRSFRRSCLSPGKIMKATCHLKKPKLTCRCSQQDGRRHSGPRGRSSCKCYYDDVRAQKARRLFSVMNGQQQPAVTVHPPQCTSTANAISHFTVTHTQNGYSNAHSGTCAHAHTRSSSPSGIPRSVWRGTSPADTDACVFYDI